MLVLPPTSTSFPYTTLFRSRLMTAGHALHKERGNDREACISVARGSFTHDILLGESKVTFRTVLRIRHEHEVRKVRSEEHTFELQSLRHLVCRLLLEKKKYK